MLSLFVEKEELIDQEVIYEKIPETYTRCVVFGNLDNYKEGLHSA